MARRSRHHTPRANAHLGPAVHGLDIGRHHARQAQRRQRLRHRILTTTLTLLALSAVAAAGWFAYSAYVDHDTNEQRETDRRVAEIEQERSGRTTEDIINELEETPAWNGPGNPTFGVGNGTDTAEP